MPSVKSLTMTYDALNERGTFSEGDTVTGAVTLAVEKDITVQTLFVKIKGDADVHWTRKSGDRTHTYSAHRRYFKLKQVLIPESSKDTAVPHGSHVYKFSFAIPPGSIPPSFRGSHGKIVYKLEAVLSRSWRMNRTVEKEIHFVSKALPNLFSLMSQQVGSTNKNVGLFSKGYVNMDVIIDKRAYVPGEKILIVAKINNFSSSEMTPKFSLVQDVVYRANGGTKQDENVIHKATGNCIKPQTQAEVKCEIMILPDQMQTIQNCDILSLEYHLKVYLDISFTFDPEVKLPVIILPHNLAVGYQPGVPTGPYPAGGVGGPINSDFPPPGAFAGPYPAMGIGGPSNSDFPPPGAFVGPSPAMGIGDPSNTDLPPQGAATVPYPNNGNIPPPGASLGPYPAGDFRGPVNVPAPGVSMGSYPASSYSDNYGYPGARYPVVYAGLPAVCPPQPAHMPHLSPYGSPLSSSSQSSVLHPLPTAPMFPPPTSAPVVHPPPSSPLLNTCPGAPTYSLLPSAPVINMDFLSQTDEAPPAYSLPSFSSDTKKTDMKE